MLNNVIEEETFGKESSSIIPDEKWGYVTVREDAHMFWWLYGAQNKSLRASLPLVIWLQGGPGASSTGFGNFVEIGPLDIELKPRSTTWIKEANVLFIDNPVGSGFSYVTDMKGLTTNGSQISEDLLTLMKTFLTVIPVFKTTPLYIFSESYGGKMTAAFGVRLYEAIRDGEINCRLDGVALGDSWISAVDSVMTWGPYLYQFNLLDQVDLAKVMNVSVATANAVKSGDYSQATRLWRQTEILIDVLTDNVNVYNVLQHHVPSPMKFISTGSKHLDMLYNRHVGVYHTESLSGFMNSVVRNKLGIIPEFVNWGSQSALVFSALHADFMKPVTAEVSKLLSFNVQVVVYQGQLDMICDTAGAELWLRKLTWPGMEKFFQALRKPVYLKGDVTRSTAAFLKQYAHLKLYYILKAGHMVPSDAGEMALQMLSQVIKREKH
eukprot:gene5523-6208_t